jgi:hypothetical protein
MSLLLLALIACETRPGAADDLARPDPAPVVRAAPPPLPGAEALRLSVTEGTVRQRFGVADPLVFELQLPAGAHVTPRGLPSYTLDTAGYELSQGHTDLTLIQLELPLARTGDVDEMHGVSTNFDPSRLCFVGVPGCLWGDDDDGRWRGWRVRTEAGVETVTELQLTEVGAGEQINGSASLRRIGVVMDTADAPLDSADRIRLEYVGHLPRLATAWHGRPLVPRLRWRLDDVAPGQTCLAADPACWTALDPSDVQPLTLRGGALTFLRVIGPHDALRGRAITYRVQALDAWMNPTPIDGDLQLTIAGTPVGPTLTFQQSWTQSATLTPPRTGYAIVGVTDPFGVRVLAQPTQVATARTQLGRRLVGDIHAHTGIDATRAFTPSSDVLDHRGNFTHAYDALRYLKEVGGADFGAISEHSTWTPGWTPPAGSPVFAPGGPCHVMEPPNVDIGAWWADSQAQSLAFQRANQDFVVFPAWEWHGALEDGAHDAKLHRVVLFKHHDPRGALPMLPGSQPDRYPQCLLGFLDAVGRTPSDTLVFPHLMYADALNDDWTLTYDPSPAWATLADRQDAQRWQPAVEVFSSRNYGPGDYDGMDVLTAMEGAYETVGAPFPWSLRYAWREVGAVIGVIGASDNHTQMPGVDNPRDAAGVAVHHHEPGGVAYVVTNPALNYRDGIWDAFSRRATYATSGIRALAHFRMSEPVAAGVAPSWHVLGEAFSTSACTLDSAFEIVTGENIRVASLWSAHVGGPEGWNQAFQTPVLNTQLLQRTVPLTNPVPAGGAPQTWVYYVRAFTGPTAPRNATAAQLARDHQDAVWTSPIWVTWQDGGCAP